MKKVIIIGALFALGICLAGCSSTSTIKEFDSQGNLVKQTETKESVIASIVASTQNKTVILFKKGWIAGVRVTVVSTDNPTPIAELIAARDNEGVVSIHKDQQNMDKIADIAKAVVDDTSLSVSTTGISSGSDSK